MTVTVLLVAAERATERARVSTSIAVPMGDPQWQYWLADVVASRAREGVARLGAEIGPETALPDRRFVPLAAVVPAADVRH